MSSSGRLVPVGMGVIEVCGSSRFDVTGLDVVVSGGRLRGSVRSRLACGGEWQSPPPLCLARVGGVGGPVATDGVMAAGAWMGGVTS
jgi:hypothetical protein